MIFLRPRIPEHPKEEEMVTKSARIKIGKYVLDLATSSSNWVRTALKKNWQWKPFYNRLGVNGE